MGVAKFSLQGGPNKQTLIIKILDLARFLMVEIISKICRLLYIPSHLDSVSHYSYYFLDNGNYRLDLFSY